MRVVWNGTPLAIIYAVTVGRREALELLCNSGGAT
jgi:hypothetical protein